MQEVIIEKLKEAEAAHHIQILYACESGSRAWGFPSPDSDFDVRFIYKHPLDWYLSVQERTDTIELAINEQLDINGWDLRKALSLIGKSNATLFEWLQSPIVYQANTSFTIGVKALLPQFFSARGIIYHHLGLVKKAYLEVGEEEEVKLKKYFYILRSLLSAMWVKEYQSVPPMEFAPLRLLLKNNISLNRLIDELLDQKKMANESTKIKKINELHVFVEQEMAVCEAFAKNAPVQKGDTETLNQLFRKTLYQ